MHASKNSKANTRQVLSLENNSTKYPHKASFQYIMHYRKNTNANTRQALSLENNSAKYPHKASFQYIMHYLWKYYLWKIAGMHSNTLKGKLSIFYYLSITT